MRGRQRRRYVALRRPNPRARTHTASMFQMHPMSRNEAGQSPREMARAFTPQLTALVEDPLFSKVWSDVRLTPRERSLATLAALIVLHRPEELPAHLLRAVDNGQRTALAWDEDVTRMRETHAPDEDYSTAAEALGERGLVDLTGPIATMNAINSLGISFRTQPSAKGQGSNRRWPWARCVPSIQWLTLRRVAGQLAESGPVPRRRTGAHRADFCNCPELGCQPRSRRPHRVGRAGPCCCPQALRAGVCGQRRRVPHACARDLLLQ